MVVRATAKHRLLKQLSQPSRSFSHQAVLGLSSASGLLTNLMNSRHLSEVLSVPCVTACGCCSVGTKNYRAPEQACNGVSCQRSDIFAFGMLAAMLVRPMFQHWVDNSMQAHGGPHGGEESFLTSPNAQERLLPRGLARIIDEDLMPAAASEDDMEIIKVISECCRPLPEQRPSAAELRHWLYYDYGHTTPPAVV